MRKFYLTVLLSLGWLCVHSQEIAPLLQEHVKFCDANITDSEVEKLRSELNQFEGFLVSKGILSDGSGASYRAVYEQIVRDKDLIFDIDTSFEMLDNLDYQVPTKCIYKLLNEAQLAEVSLRHLEAAERISGAYEGDITPAAVAQRILDNISEKDFELEFFRLSSLLAFYRVSSPGPTLDFGMAEFEQDRKVELETILVKLNEQNEVEIDSKVFSDEEVRRVIYSFLSVDPEKRGIKYATSRNTLYETYLKTKEMLLAIYERLRAEKGDIPIHIIYLEPK